MVLLGLDLAKDMVSSMIGIGGDTQFRYCVVLFRYCVVLPLGKLSVTRLYLLRCFVGFDPEC